MKMRNILWIVVGIIVGCAISSIFFLTLMGVIFTLATNEPKDISIELTAPIVVEKDEGFEVVIAITNSANRAKELNSIDVELSYLEGMHVHGSEPDFVEFSISEDADSFSSFWYYLEIPANSTVTVNLRLIARKVGDFSGQISVCINYDYNCSLYSTRVVVTE